MIHLLKEQLSNLKFLFKYYLNIRQNLSSQLKGKTREVKKSKTVLVPLIETNHYQHFQILILSKALQIRGAKVKIIVCDGYLDGCEIKSVKNKKYINPCFKCKFNLKKTHPFFDLDTIKIGDIIDTKTKLKIKEFAKNNFLKEKITYKDMDITQSINDSILRYFYGKIPDESNVVNEIKFKHTLTAITSHEIARLLNINYNPDIILNNMNVYSAWDSFYKYFKSNNTESFVISMAAYDFNKIKVNLFEVFESRKRFTKFLLSRNKRPLDKSELKELNFFLNKRKNGQSDIFKKYNYFSFDSSDAIQKLNLKKSNKNIFIFTNILWDIGISENNGIFKDILDWVYKTIEFVKERNDLTLYIKTHPAEEFDSQKSKMTVYEHTIRKFKKLPKNVCFILPSMKINTYLLFPYIDLGIIYSGTLGLEMLLEKIPVVTVSNAPYSGLDFSYEPQSNEEYFKCLIEERKFKNEKYDDIRLFAFFYFIKFHLPWNLTKKVFADNFNGFTFDSLDDITPGKNKYLDHLTNYILDSKNNCIENW